MRRDTIPSTDLAWHNFSESAIISAFFRLASKQGKALAFWQLPNATEKHLALDLGEVLTRGPVDLEEAPAGFIFSPFDHQEGQHTLFIQAHFHLVLDNDRVEISQTPDHSDILDDLRNELASGDQDCPLYFKESEQLQSSAESYESTIQQALQEIATGSFLKVVPAIAKSIPLNKSLDCLQTFYSLCGLYPAAFKSMVSIPQVGSWMGASPEPIIEIDKQKNFSTAALAGTQAFDPQISLQEVAWRQKEIEEQALVSRYIINCFKKIRLREFEEVGPRTVAAGNLLHLKSTYVVDMVATNFPQLGTVMLNLLHPTSAICGMPQAPAKTFLKEHEDFSREFFSGYLGPVNIAEETHCFVNLRCMQLHGDSVTLYAGAGVTADSDPAKEWRETQLKFDTLLAVLNETGK